MKELDEAKYESDRLSGIEAKYEQQEAYVRELESQVSACQDQRNEFWNRDDTTKATGDRVQKSDHVPPRPNPHEQRRPTFFSLTNLIVVTAAPRNQKRPKTVQEVLLQAKGPARDLISPPVQRRTKRLTLLSSPLGPRLPNLDIGSWTQVVK